MRKTRWLLTLVCVAVLAPTARGGTESTNPWSLVAPSTGQPAQDVPTRPRASAGMSAVADELVLFGGYEECFSSVSTCDNVWYNDVYAFDLTTKRWRKGAPSGPAPQARGYVGQVAYKRSAIVFGGGRYSTRLVDLTVFGDMWQYFPPSSPGGERWVKRLQHGTGPGPRMGPGVEVVGDHLYVFGGVSSIAFSEPGSIEGTPLSPNLLERHNDLWRYNLVTSAWQLLVPDSGLPTPEPIEELESPGRRHISQFKASADKKSIYLYGGNTFAVGGQWNDLWVYDIATNRWTEQPIFVDENPADPQDASKFVGRTHGASGTIGSNFVVTMGDKDHEASECDTIQPSQGQRPTNQTWVFDSSSATWRHLAGVPADGPPPPLKRVAFAQKDGRMYVYGGFGYDCAAGVALWNTDIWSLDMTAIAG